MITILGPTASGKTPLAAALAAQVNGEIISADSRQVYRRMDIGTGKDLADYTLPSSSLHPFSRYEVRDTRYENTMPQTFHPSPTPQSNLVPREEDTPQSNLAPRTSHLVPREEDNSLSSLLSPLSSKTIPYHLIDICEPGTKYNLFRYQQDFFDAYQDICARGRQPILCGGTGLYIEAVLKGYKLSPVPQNPQLRASLEGRTLDEFTQMLTELKTRTGTVMHNTTDVDSCQRAIRAIEIETYNLEHPTPQRELPPVDSLIIGVNIDRDLRREKITRRLKARLDEGMVDEVQRLLDEGIPPADLIYYGLEYKYVTEYLIGQTTYDQMFQRLEIAIHQFAKRQMTWFRGMERRGFHIHWIDATLPMDEKVQAILRYYDAEKGC